MYNINSGYGQHVKALPFIGQGQISVVSASTVVGIQILQDIFRPFNGKARHFTTVDEAISSSVANRGDVVYVAPGHTEAVTATSIALDVAGVKVIGLGKGLERPTFTFGAAASTITVTGANCSWENTVLVANFDNVAAAFTVGAAKDFACENNLLIDNSNALHFISAVVTGATDNAADGLTVKGNMWHGLALAPNAFVSVLGNLTRLNVSENEVFMAATNDVGHFLTASSKVLLAARVSHNKCIVTGATNATVGVFFTGSGTSTGVISNNYVSSLDVTGQLLATAGTGLSFFENYYPVAADKNGALLPANS